MELIWVYYIQNLIIGYFNFKRMKSLKNFSTSGLRMNKKPVPETEKGKDSTAFFFLIHYGFFHLIYFIFLLKGCSLNLLTFLSIAVSAIIFYFNHQYSYQINHERDLAGCPNLGHLMFIPYLRVVPMHLVVIFGAISFTNSLLGLLIFSVLKTISDVLMHIVEHRILQKIKN